MNKKQAAVQSYKVVDPQGVYEDQIIKVPFVIDPTKQAQYVVMANYATVKAIAVELMAGGPISQIDAQVVRDMFENLEIEGV